MPLFVNLLWCVRWLSISSVLIDSVLSLFFMLVIILGTISWSDFLHKETFCVLTELFEKTAVGEISLLFLSCL